MRRILIDYGKCVGCMSCSLACMQAHRWNQGTLFDLDLENNTNESRNCILTDSAGNYRPLFCRHCAHPECVDACVNGALIKDKDSGLVFYREGKCVSCFMCVMNCSYGVLKPDSQSRCKIIKCDFCGNTPEGPNCVNSCPTNAIYLEEVPI